MAGFSSGSGANGAGADTFTSSEVVGWLNPLLEAAGFEDFKLGNNIKASDLRAQLALIMQVCTANNRSMQADEQAATVPAMNMSIRGLAAAVKTRGLPNHEQKRYRLQAEQTAMAAFNKLAAAARAKVEAEKVRADVALTLRARKFARMWG